MAAMGRWVAGMSLAAMVALGAWGLRLGSQAVGTPSAPRPPTPPPQVLQVDTPATRVIRAAHQDVEADPRNAEAWYQLGLAYVANSAEEPARLSLLQATQLDEAHARAWYLLAVLAEQGHDLDQAIAFARTALELEPSYAPGWCRLGEWLIERDERSAALEAFRRAAAADPGLLRAALGPARVALADGRPHEALLVLEPLRDAAGASSADPLLRQLHVTASIRAGASTDHAPSLAPAKSDLNDPWLAEADAYRADRRSRSARATALVSSGRPEAAIPILEALFREDPTNPAVLCNLVAAHRARGDLQRSAALGEEAVRRFPDSHQTYFNLALTRLAQGRRPDGAIAPEELEQATRLLDAAIARNPASAQARAVRAGLHAMAGELPAAIDQYGHAAVADPTNPVWLIERSRVELAADRREGAVVSLRRALRLDPSRADALALLEVALTPSVVTEAPEKGGHK
jgi:tetratricopeptide (TPR) repeat protein